MSKPIIAVDIDDVLLDSAVSVIEHYNATWGTNATTDHWYVLHSSVWNAPDSEEVLRRADEYLESEAYFQLQPFSEAVDALRALSERYELHALTGRKDATARLTRQWLKRHFPGIFHSVTFTNMYDQTEVRSKGDICRQMGAEYLIDDYPAHCISAGAAGVRVVLFGMYPWNRMVKLPEGVTRCNNWAAVLDYFEKVGAHV